MLAGLSPLLTDGPVLSFVSKDSSSTVSIRGGAVLLDGALRAGDADKDAVAAPPGTPVAVLLNGKTASSGEAVAISFLGQAGVRTVGEPTRGFSTVNDPRDLPDGAAINLTVAVDADRNGTRYGHAIRPDSVVTKKQAPTAAARQWLHQRCRP